uniref:hypothetical protein n=1 Tax=Fusobacterium mortiferum TaxID=850 RepID=UPI001958538C
TGEPKTHGGIARRADPHEISDGPQRPALHMNVNHPTAVSATSHVPEVYEDIRVRTAVSAAQGVVHCPAAVAVVTVAAAKVETVNVD